MKKSTCFLLALLCALLLFHPAVQAGPLASGRSTRGRTTPPPFSILPAVSDSQMTEVFGPKEYTRATGLPQTFTDIFTHCGTQQCQIVIVNGNADGTNRISSASILLNGTEVVGLNAFNQRVGNITKPVVLADENQLVTKLASEPGSFMTIKVECLASPVILSLGGPGVSLRDQNQTLLSAVPIINSGTAPAQNVEITEITLPGGQLTSPTPLPFNLGTIPADDSTVLNANFSGAFSPSTDYPLTVKGTYAVNDATYCFTLNTDLTTLPASPGSAPVSSVQVTTNFVTGGGFPSQPPYPFEEEVNQQNWTVPIGPFVPGTPTPTPALKMPVPSTAMTRLTPFSLDPPDVVFEANNPLGLISGNWWGAADTVAEPSGATGGGVVFVTANHIAAYSTDGVNFTQLDPTTIFPATGVGLCCDQIVQYVPSIDRFIWLIQGNGMRIAWASPQDIISSGGTAWMWVDLTPDVFGAVAGTDFDYPDVAVGDNFLYMSWNAGVHCPPGCQRGHQVARTSLAGIQTAQIGSIITVDFTHPEDSPNAWGAHLMQNPDSETSWAGHVDSSTLRVWRWGEGWDYVWFDVDIARWAEHNLGSITPDGFDWTSECESREERRFPGTAVIGSTRVGDEFWFAWSAGKDENFPQPHIEMVVLDRSKEFQLVRQEQLWSNDWAAAYPALATNACTGEVGISFETGGNGWYPNHTVGIWGDGFVYDTTESNVGTCRFGDYVTIRQATYIPGNPGNLFAAFGYGLNTAPPPGTGTNVDIRYVLFGRPASSCAPGKPDLIPVPGPAGFCQVDGAGRLIIKIRNQGTTSASGSMTKVEFCSGPGQVVVTLNTPPIDPGAVVELNVDFPPGCADRSFTITVDSSNQVDEIDEGNNSASGQCIG
jgi:hypothetical protein